MRTKKSIVSKIAIGVIAIILFTTLSIKTGAERPNCIVELDDGIYKCYGEASQCRINDNIVCKGTRLVVLKPDNPE